jgi:hypothetical protein
LGCVTCFSIAILHQAQLVPEIEMLVPVISSH